MFIRIVKSVYKVKKTIGGVNKYFFEIENVLSEHFHFLRVIEPFHCQVTNVSLHTFEFLNFFHLKLLLLEFRSISQ